MALLRQLQFKAPHHDSLDNALRDLASIPGLAAQLRELEFRRVQHLAMNQQPEETLVELQKLQGINDFLLRLEQELIEIASEAGESPLLSQEIEIE